MTIDIWSGLDHYAGMGDNDGGDFNLGGWVDETDERRLKAYQILQSIMETVNRNNIIPPATEDDDDFLDSWREFGDAAVFAERLTAGVLGTTIEVGVVGADDAIPDQAVLPAPPVAPSDDLEGVAAQVARDAFKAAEDVYKTAAERIIERWVLQAEMAPLLQERQDWIREWAVKDQFLAKVMESELEWTVPLGGSMWVMGWDYVKQRPSTEIFEPGFYFPELNEQRPSQFPKRVHMAWGFTQEDDAGNDQRYVRRMTWELAPLDPALAEAQSEGAEVEPAADVGEALRYLVDTPDGAPAPVQTEACVFTDATWEEGDFKNVYDMDLPGGVFAQVAVDDSGVLVDADRIPMNLDFIPVVHVTNTLANSDQHFGRSPLVRTAKLFDEICGHDTDASLAAEWAARPPVAASGLKPNTETIDLSAGQAVALSDNGRIFTVDMAASMAGLEERGLSLRKLAGVQMKVPDGLVGRVDASDVPSGVAFTLSFTSFEQEVGRMRMARDPKYALILKMIQRIAIQNQDPTLDGQAVVYPCEMQWGSFMPQDLNGLAQVLHSLRQSKLVSQETGVAMLQDAGIASRDADAEVAAIRHGDPETAGLVADATGSNRSGADYLGLEFDEEAQEDPEAQGGGFQQQAAQAAAQPAGASS